MIRSELPLSIWRVLGIIWTLPNSLLGLSVGLLGLVTGGSVRRIGSTLEFHGPAIRWLLQHLLISASAMTLGHVIIGQDAASLERSRLHEWVHVRQYERWGPFFIPVYLGCSLWLWLNGKHFYRDNPFEVEAYTADRLRRETNRN